MSQSEYRNASFTNSWHLYLNRIRNQTTSLCSNLTHMIHECQSSFQDPLSNSSDEIYQRFQQRFLYPDDYHSIDTLPSEIIQRANSTSCCYDHDIAKNTALWIFRAVQSDNNSIKKFRNLLSKTSGARCYRELTKSHKP